jgi:hypothetical protein
MTDSQKKHPDADIHKGAVESDRPQSADHRLRIRESNEYMAGQLGHRDADAMLKDNDTDFPEHDAEAEHSGGRAQTQP